MKIQDKRDLIFLREMKKIAKQLFYKNDKVLAQNLYKMIEDWEFELLSK